MSEFGKANMTAPRRERPQLLTGPLVLITLGALLLATNLGVLPWTVWEVVWRLWPLALVALGLELLLGDRSAAGRLAAAGTLLIAALLAVWWTQNLPAGSTFADHNVQYELRPGIERAELSLRPGVADLNVGVATDEALISGRTSTLEGVQWRDEYVERADAAFIRLEGRGGQNLSVIGRPPAWELGLAPNLPWALRVSAGVGTTNLDMRELRVSDLQLDGGVGAITVTLPAQGVTRAELRGGVGTLTVRLPEGTSARITARAGLGDVNVALPAVSEGGTYTIGDPDTSANRAEVHVNGGVGRVQVERAR